MVSHLSQKFSDRFTVFSMSETRHVIYDPATNFILLELDDKETIEELFNELVKQQRVYDAFYEEWKTKLEELGFVVSVKTSSVKQNREAFGQEKQEDTQPAVQLLVTYTNKYVPLFTSKGVPATQAVQELKYIFENNEKQIRKIKSRSNWK